MQHRSSHLSLRTGTSTRPLVRARPAQVAPLRARRAADDTLTTYAERWLASVRSGVRERTFESYESQLRLHVLPLLGDRPLADLDVEDILELIDHLRSAGYTGWTIRTVLTPLSRLLNRAVRRGAITVNPISRLERTERPGRMGGGATDPEAGRDPAPPRRCTAAVPDAPRDRRLHRPPTGRAARTLLGGHRLRGRRREGAEVARPARAATGSEDAAGGAGRRAHARARERTPGAPQRVTVRGAGRLRVLVAERDAVPLAEHRASRVAAGLKGRRATSPTLARPAAHVRLALDRERREHRLRLAPAWTRELGHHAPLLQPPLRSRRARAADAGRARDVVRRNRVTRRRRHRPCTNRRA